MKLDQLDTPSLLIDRERLLKNLADMQRYADSHGGNFKIAAYA